MAKEIKNLLINHIHDRRLLKYASKHFTGKLVDIGCGTKLYKKLLTSIVQEHIGVDHITITGPFMINRILTVLSRRMRYQPMMENSIALCVPPFWSTLRSQKRH